MQCLRNCGGDLKDCFLAGCAALGGGTWNSNCITIAEGHPVRVFPGLGVKCIVYPRELRFKISDSHEEDTICSVVNVAHGRLTRCGDSSPNCVGIIVSASPFWAIHAELMAQLYDLDFVGQLVSAEQSVVARL